MDATTYGLDVAKRVFQMYWVEVETGEILNRRFGREELIRFLAQRPPGRRGGLGNQDTAIGGHSATTRRARRPGKQKDHEQTTTPKPLVDLQGQGGLGRHPSPSHAEIPAIPLLGARYRNDEGATPFNVTP